MSVLLWVAFSMVARLDDDTACIEPAVLERELQARAPAATVDVHVSRTAGGRVVRVLVTNLAPPVERVLDIRDVECPELPRAIALIAAAAFADRDVLDGPSLFVDESTRTVDSVAGEAGAVTAPRAPTAQRRRDAKAVDAPVWRAVVSGGAQIGVAGTLFLAGDIGAGAQLAARSWRGAVQGRLRQTLPVPLGPTWASLTSLAIEGDAGARVTAFGVELQPHGGLEAGGGVASRLDAKRLAFVPRVDAQGGIDVAIGRGSVGIALRVPLVPFVLVEAVQRVPEPPLWIGAAACWSL